MARQSDVVKRLDKVVDGFQKTTRFFHEPFNRGRAEMFVMQHRLNTRFRNSVLKLKVATNCPDWDTRVEVIGAVSEEIIADEEFGGGKPHWEILEELGVAVGMSRARIRAAKPLETTQLAWNAWMGLMANTHWLEGLVANVIVERACTPGYGTGIARKHGWFGVERTRWKKLFDLPEEKLTFFKLHEEADLIHSDIGWKAVTKFAKQLHMEDAVIEKARQNIIVWQCYLNGIGDAGDILNRKYKRQRKTKRARKK